MENKIGKIPEFTEDTPSEELGKVSDKSEKSTDETSVEEEKETPTEPSAEEQPAEEQLKETLGEDIGVLKEKLKDELRKELKTEIEKEVQGLKEARKELILELGELRGERRKAKEAEIREVQDKIDDLKDLHPQDVEIVERILQSKGYVSKGTIDKMLYESRKQEEIAKFLGEFREYSEENDPNRQRFDPLLREVSLYKEPEDPKMWGTLLRRAHKALTGTQTASDRTILVKKQQLKVAGVGAGGSQRSSSITPFDYKKRQRLLDGGWSEEEIKEMEQRQ